MARISFDAIDEIAATSFDFDDKFSDYSYHHTYGDKEYRRNVSDGLKPVRLKKSRDKKGRYLEGRC